MQSKEWREAGRQLAYFLASVALLTLILLIGQTITVRPSAFAEKFMPLVQVFLISFALISGIAVFATEKKQRGMEYLLSLPYSRLQILRFKLLPRLAVVLALYLAYLGLWKLGPSEYFLLPIFAFTAVYIAVWIISFSLSIFSDNFVELAVFSGLMLVVYYLANLAVYLAFLLPGYSSNTGYSIERFLNEASLGLLIDPKSMKVWITVPIVLLLLPFPLAFAWAFRKFDLRPVRVHLKRFFAFFTPAFVAAFLASAAFFYFSFKPKMDFWSLYLTRDLKLIQSVGTSQLTVYSTAGKQEVPTGSDGIFTHLFEEGDYIYDSGNYSENKFFYLSRFNLKTLFWELLYTVPRSQKIGYSIYKYQNQLCWLERKPVATETDQNSAVIDLPENTLYLVILNLSDCSVRRLNLQLKEFREFFLGGRILGVGWRNEKKFWVMNIILPKKDTIGLLWEDGRWESIGASPGWRELYRNGLLISFTDKALSVYRLAETGLVKVFEKKALNNRFYRWERYFDELDRTMSERIFFWHKRNLETLDLRDFSIHTVVQDFTSMMDRLIVRGEKTFLIRHTKERKIVIFDISTGSANLFREMDWLGISADFYYQVFESGIVTRDQGRIRVFAFPDLREITYKGLN